MNEAFHLFLIFLFYDTSHTMPLRHRPNEYSFMKKVNLLIILCFICISKSFSQDTIIPLWPDNIPNSRPSEEKENITTGNIKWIRNVQEPDIACFLPTKQNRTGASVLICPGGGYGGLAYDWEGTDIARWFSGKGIAAFVLKYRLPGSESFIQSDEAPLQDAQRAIRLIRTHASHWNLDQAQIGVMGFSAGGHLASTLGTLYDTPQFFEYDYIDSVSAKPDFMILVYPVISMEEKITHKGSKSNLLGEYPTQALVKRYSNELNVDEETPPAFILHASDDEAVPVANSLRFYEALIENEIPVEMHLFPSGGHGFSLAIGKGQLSAWPDILHQWLLNLLSE